jgi:hypothetical protein
MTTEILPRVRPAVFHPARPLGRARTADLVNAVLFYGILGFGLLTPVAFALYGVLFR